MHSVTLHQLVFFILCTTLVVAVIYDYLWRRIPNLVSLSGWVIAPIAYLFIDGMPGLQSSLLGFGLILLLTFPLFVFKWMGAGDVKLMAAVGAYVGGELAPYVLFGIVMSGAVAAVLLLAYHRILLVTVSRIKASVGISLATKSMFYLGPDEAGKRIVLPYAIPIMAGTLIALFTLNKF